MPDELTTSQREEIAAELRRARGELRALIADEAGLSGTVELDQARVGRVSRIDAMQHQQMAAATRRRAERRLEGVEAALERLAEDPEGFGWCPECGEPIGYRRLKVLPESVFCVACLNKR
ncbi:MAG: TraR/DksA C4-type zinc finger protein [Alphaproteobacteria bacterium]|nr:TraR/DksA C4-type zinc finger protein [Alphaproteobacteria bacterium]